MAVSESNNLEAATVAEVGFVNPAANDFHLLPTSAAVDAGSDTGYAPFDYDNVSRPQGIKADQGAFEFVPTAEDMIDAYFTIDLRRELPRR